ncbi:MAG: hypothetical protein NW237_02330 [Cyanobacteriota bacterium]|nr:hypothetical protein [Cyanobacteriota bacterium]
MMTRLASLPPPSPWIPFPYRCSHPPSPHIWAVAVAVKQGSSYHSSVWMDKDSPPSGAMVNRVISATKKEGDPPPP